MSRISQAAQRLDRTLRATWRESTQESRIYIKIHQRTIEELSTVGLVASFLTEVLTSWESSIPRKILPLESTGRPATRRKELARAKNTPTNRARNFRQISKKVLEIPWKASEVSLLPISSQKSSSDLWRISLSKAVLARITSTCVLRKYARKIGRKTDLQKKIPQRTNKADRRFWFRKLKNYPKARSKNRITTRTILMNLQATFALATLFEIP